MLIHRNLPQEGEHFIAQVVRPKSSEDTVIAERPTDLELKAPATKHLDPPKIPDRPTTVSDANETRPTSGQKTVVKPLDQISVEVPSSEAETSVKEPTRFASKPSSKPAGQPPNKPPPSNPPGAVNESPEQRKARLEKKISERATKFEILPLIRVLESIGYSFEDIIWRSSTNTATMIAIIESVEFLPKKSGYVRICLSRGLMGTEGLLPSYFLRMVEKMPDPEPFYDFIHFFDHTLLRDYVLALYPSLNSPVFGDWTKLKQSYFGMLGVPSEATLTWIFQLYFPELVIKVKREALANTTDSYAFRTGQSALDGTGVIGNQYASAVNGFAVQMIAAEEQNEVGKIWPHVVKERLNTKVRPVLGQFRLHLNLSLLVSEHATWAGIQSSGFLGYDRIRGSADSGHNVVVHKGPFLPG